MRKILLWMSIILIGLLGISFICPAFNAAAERAPYGYEEESLVLILCLDKNNYKVGDQLTATIHVLSEGQHVVPDDDPTLTLNPY